MDLLNPGIVHFHLIPELTNHDLFTFFTLTKDNYLGYLQESKRILKNRYSKCTNRKNIVTVSWINFVAIGMISPFKLQENGPILVFHKDKLLSFKMFKNGFLDDGIYFHISYVDITPYQIDNGAYVKLFKRVHNGWTHSYIYESLYYSGDETGTVKIRYFDTFSRTAKIDDDTSTHKAYQDIKRTIKKYEQLYYPK